MLRHELMVEGYAGGSTELRHTTEVHGSGTFAPGRLRRCGWLPRTGQQQRELGDGGFT